MPKRLCEAYILSKVTYCIHCITVSLSRIDKMRLKKVQNNCFRFIYGFKKFYYASQKLQELKWSKMENLYQYLFLSLTYKSLKTRISANLKSELIFPYEFQNISLRTNPTLAMICLETHPVSSNVVLHTMQ